MTGSINKHWIWQQIRQNGCIDKTAAHSITIYSGDWHITIEAKNSVRSLGLEIDLRFGWIPLNSTSIGGG